MTMFDAPNRDRNIIKRLVRQAAEKRCITYGQLAQECGGIARGYGPRLSRIAHWCHENGLPLLSVLVVNAGSGLPSADASIYSKLGIERVDQFRAEQERCFDHDWNSSPIG